MNTIQVIELIAINPEIRNGHPYIVGTTVTVADIAITKVFRMMDADEIAEHFEISLPQVYSALAYYYDHKAEIDQSIHERRKLAAELKEQRIGSRHQPLFG